MGVFIVHLKCILPTIMDVRYEFFVILIVQCQCFTFSPVNLDVPYPVQSVLMCINYLALSSGISKLRFGPEILSLIDYYLWFTCILLHVTIFLLWSESLWILFIFYQLCNIKFLVRFVLETSSDKVYLSFKESSWKVFTMEDKHAH